MKVRDIFKHPWVLEFEKKYFEQKMKKQKEEESNFSLLGLKEDDCKDDSSLKKSDSIAINESQAKIINENLHNDFSIFHENVEESDTKKNKIVVNNKKEPISEKQKESNQLLEEDADSKNFESMKFQSEKEKALQEIQMCKQNENRVKSMAQNINTNIDMKKNAKESKIENNEFSVVGDSQKKKDFDTKSANIMRNKTQDNLLSAKQSKPLDTLSNNHSVDIALKESKLDHSDFLGENKNSDNLFDNVLLQVEKKNKGSLIHIVDKKKKTKKKDKDELSNISSNRPKRNKSSNKEGDISVNDKSHKKALDKISMNTMLQPHPNIILREEPKEQVENADKFLDDDFLNMKKSELQNLANSNLDDTDLLQNEIKVTEYYRKKKLGSQYKSKQNNDYKNTPNHNELDEETKEKLRLDMETELKDLVSTKDEDLIDLGRGKNKITDINRE